LARILDSLSPDPGAIGAWRLSDESVRQISDEYDDVLRALDTMTRAKCTTIGEKYRILINLRDEFEKEMTRLLQQP
jgi:hypothetical protein